VGSSVRDLARAIGDINVNGNVFSANGANLKLDKTVGTVFSYGRNYTVNKLDPNTISVAADTALTFNYIWDNGSGGATVGAPTTDINPNNWDNGTGTLDSTGGGKFTIQRILMFANSGNVFVQYGTEEFNNFSAAKNGFATTSFPNLTGFLTALTRGYIIVRQGETDLTSSNVVFIQGLNTGGIDTDNQTIDTFDIVSKQIRLSLEGDNEPAKTVDLGGFVEYSDSLTTFVTPTMLDDSTAAIRGDFPVNTDDQTLSIDSVAVTGGRRFTVSIQDGNSVSFIDSIGSGGGGISGGVANYLTRWSGATSLDTTGLYWTGGRLGLGTITPGAKFETIGQGSSNSTFSFIAKNSLGVEQFKVQDGHDLIVNGDMTLGYGNYNQVSNLAFGRLALASNISGTDNIAIGQRSLEELSTGLRNTAIGSTALNASNTNENVAVGWGSMINVTTNNNTAIGTRTLQENNSSSGGNVAIGFQAAQYVTNRFNTAIGAFSMSAAAVTNVRHNIAIGAYTMSTIPTGSDENTSVGYASMGLVGGDYNTNLGALGGTLNTAGGNFTSANKYTSVGYNTRGTQGSTNETVLGAEAFGKGSNTATIGSSAVTVLYLAGAVGWFQGTGSPEGVVTAPVGSFYSRTDGGTGTTFYVKEVGSGNTGWTAK
jgi:hypothetical protein